MNENNLVWTKFDLKNNLIKEYKYWNLLVRKSHIKLGSCVALLKRDCYPLSEITAEEMAEYAILTKDVELSLKKAFDPHTIHHMALMFVDKHIHFHIIPRYSKVISFAGKDWTDDNIPDPLMQKGDEISQEILNTIKNKISENITS